MSGKQVDLALNKEMGMLVRIAYKVRDAFEEIGQKEQLPQDLCGLCLRSSVQLFVAAKYFGIDIQVIGGYGHCYTMRDGYIIDVTATQFCETERVLVVPPSRTTYYHNSRSKRWDKEKICETLDSIYADIWDESSKFESDRRIIVKYLTPLMREELAWLGKESVACM